MVKINYVGKCLLLEESGERVLVLGDLHLGYEGAMRNSGVMIPVKLYQRCVADFDEIYNYILINNFGKKRINGEGDRLVSGSHVGLIGEKLGKEIRGERGKINKIIILGDVKHEFGFILDDEWDQIVSFLEYLKKRCDELVVIEGNHDKILFPILKKLDVVAVDYYLWRGFIFAHGDKEYAELYDGDVKYWVLGHGHPAINLTEGIKRESYKCFLTGKYKDKKIILVPSFFPLIAGTDAREFDLGYPFDFNLKNFDVFVVGDKLEVFKFGKLGKIIY